MILSTSLRKYSTTALSPIRVMPGCIQFAVWPYDFYINKSGRRALGYALHQMGLKENDRRAWQSNLVDMTHEMMGIYMHHEMGELTGNVFDRDVWQEMIAAYPRSSVELFARAIKDILADTGKRGTLNYILAEHRSASLGFYVAFREGMLKTLFPEIP